RDAAIDTASRIGLSDAQKLARASGAWSVVTGQVNRGGDSLHVVARLYDVASGRSLEQTQQSIPADADPREVFDMIARALLRISGAPPISPALARTTTSSLSAYRDYLEGVRALNGWQLDRADSLLGRAVATDSTFALAHYKRALGRGWSHLPDSINVLMIEAAARHSGRLPQRDRALIDSYLAMARGLAALNRGDRALAPPYLEQARRRYAELVSHDSADAESWYGLGDAHFHSAHVIGDRPDAVSDHWTRALRAFNRTLALDSTFHLAYAHKLLIYQAAGTDGAPIIVTDDSVHVFASDSAARRYGAGRIAETRRRARILAVEQARHWVATDPLAPAAHSALADAYAGAGEFTQAALVLSDALSRPGVGTADMAFRIAALEMAGGDADAFGAVEEALRGQDPAALVAGDDVRRAAALTAAATVAAYSGARGSMERLLELRTRTDPIIPGTGLASTQLLPVWRATLALGMGAEDRAVRRDIEQAITTLDRLEGPVGERLREQSAQLPFAAYLQQRDTAFLDVLQRWTGKDTPPELLVLAAIDAGDSARAARLADALPEADVVESPLGGAPSVLRRFARAEIYAAMGDPRHALRVYDTLDPRQFASSLGTPDPRWPLFARSFLVRGQLFEQLGEHDNAAAAYEHFLVLWRNADPAFAAADLRMARQGLARARGESGARARG
ncbi:MAG: tetratricopeptide repeat protein, partial [Gemmatimonadaceae bacterium]